MRSGRAPGSLPGAPTGGRDEWQQVVLSDHAPDSASQAIIEFGWDAESPETTLGPQMSHICFDAFLFREGEDPTYFDGESEGAEWEGQ